MNNKAAGFSKHAKPPASLSGLSALSGLLLGSVTTSLKKYNKKILLITLCTFITLFSCGTTETGNPSKAHPEETSLNVSKDSTVSYASGKPHLAVFPFSAGDDPIAERLSSVIYGNLGLNIRLLGSHQLVEEVFPGKEYSEEAVRSFSYNNEIDNTLYGEVTTSDGSYSIFYRIYDTAEDRIVFENEYTIDSVLLVFEATENITEEILSHLADRRLAFGSIEIRTDLKEIENYTVKLNDVSIDITDNVIKVFAGPCSLKILDDNGTSLFRKNFTVTGEGPAVVEIPGFIQTYNTPPGWHFLKDNNGDLWTSFANGGIGKYSYHEDRWVRYSRTEGLDSKGEIIVSMVEDNDYIWMTYGNVNNTEISGVSRWNPETGEMTHFGPEEGTPGFPGGSVWFGAKRNDGTLWFGMGDGLEPLLFNGSSWSSFPVEEGTAYTGASYVAFEGDRGYFKTYRGGLHVYDFTQDSWLHTPYGAARGTESFFAGNFWPGDIALLSGGRIVIAASDGPAGSNPDLKKEDGVWYFDGSVWQNISEALPDSPGLARQAVVDDQERVWCFFTEDYTIRIWDGGHWEKWAPLGFVPSPDNFLQPRYIDGDWVWMIHKNKTGMHLARARYR